MSAAVAFALAYLMSYLYRSANAVISPELTRELALDPASLGLLTSGYFVGFGLTQVPAGMLLDRYGPRRVEPVLLAIAAAGAFAFAAADSMAELAIARGAIGVGVAVCLMAPLKAIAVWQPTHRHATLAGWMMVAGGLGAIGATAPLEWALRFVTWRTAFVAFGVVTLLVALLIAWRVPDMPRASNAAGLRAQFAGVRQVFSSGRFWWIAPLGGFGMGSFMAVQGLWAVPWLMEVDGLSRAGAAQVLLLMGVVTLTGYVGIGLFAQRLASRGVSSRHLFVAGFALNTLALLGITLRLPGGVAWWAIYGFGAAVNVLGFTALNEGFARHLAARANTALNLVMFGGSFVVQWGIGVLAAAAARAGGVGGPTALRIAFAVVLAGDLLALAWFVRGWRRYAVPGALVA